MVSTHPIVESVNTIVAYAVLRAVFRSPSIVCAAPTYDEVKIIVHWGMANTFVGTNVLFSTAGRVLLVWEAGSVTGLVSIGVVA